MKYFWDAGEKIKKIILSKKKKVVFLDFDGTLVSIAPTPDGVRLDPEIRKVLLELSRNERVHLVIISGRPLKELSSYLKMKNVTLAGNHGLEIKGRGLTLPTKAKQARRLRNFISLMSLKFKAAFSHYPGVFVEDKKFTLSVHFRNLPSEQESIFKTLVKFFKEKYCHYPIVWTQGKKVVEIRPSVYWGKGDTVEYLMKKNVNALPIAIGDDKTDEEMFKVLKKIGGIALHVGNLKSSLADYSLKSPLDVKTFLQELSLAN